jgi:hypothetical protein
VKGKVSSPIAKLYRDKIHCPVEINYYIYQKDFTISVKGIGDSEEGSQARSFYRV